MELIVDHREPLELKTLVSDYLKQRGLKECTFSHLPCGDFAIKQGEDTRILFERKTWSDLASSIKDGRWSEQKQLICSNNLPVFVIIERDPKHQGSLFDTCDRKINGIPKSTLVSCFVNALIRDNINILNTNSVKETCDMILSFYERMNKSPEKYTGGQSDKNEYEDVLQRAAKMRVTGPVQCYEQQLCAIPGISIQTSRAISKVYPNMIDLVESLKKMDNHEKRVDLLLNTVHIVTNEGTEKETIKKLSTRVAHTISNMLFHEFNFSEKKPAKEHKKTTVQKKTSGKKNKLCVRIDTSTLFEDDSEESEPSVDNFELEHEQFKSNE